MYLQSDGALAGNALGRFLRVLEIRDELAVQLEPPTQLVQRNVRARFDETAQLGGSGPVAFLDVVFGPITSVLGGLRW